MSTLTERAKQCAKYKKMSMAQFQESLGLSIGHFYNTKCLTRKVARLIEEKFPEFDIDWIATGNGQMIKEGLLPKMATDVGSFYVPILPIAAQGCTTDSFENQITLHDCEMILSPVANVDLAISVTGDSMSPEFPNGSKVIVQKVDKDAFIEWGAPYALDTVNGAIIKNVYQAKDDPQKVICRSVNPNFADFTISVSDVRGWYRVRCCIIIK